MGPVTNMRYVKMGHKNDSPGSDQKNNRRVHSELLFVASSDEI